MSAEYHAAFVEAEKARARDPSVSRAWKLAEPYRIARGAARGKDISFRDWQRSHDGVTTALRVCGFTLLTTAEELATANVPPNGIWGYRKVDVARGDVVRIGVRINDLLNGKSKLMSDEEKDEANAQRRAKQKAAQPKGVATSTEIETKAINDLHALIGLEDHLEIVHGMEFRCADVLMRPHSSGGINDSGEEPYVGDQVKSSHVRSDGQENFNIDVGQACRIIGGGNFVGRSGKVIAVWKKMSLTLIGMDSKGAPTVVWFLWGEKALDMLVDFPDGQTFRPRLFLRRTSTNTFTEAMNSPEWRYDVGQGSEATKMSERRRLLEAKCAFATSDYAAKETLRFWHDDLSQIPLDSHRKEQLILNGLAELLRGLCTIARNPKDNCGPVDFRVTLPDGKITRVQSKMVTAGKSSGKDYFHMRKTNGVPYDLTTFDSLDITDVRDDITWTLPTHVRNDELGGIVPAEYFSAEELDKNTVHLSQKWREKHEKYRCDLKTEVGRHKYVALQEGRAMYRSN
jgi:hypothetical protein